LLTARSRKPITEISTKKPAKKRSEAEAWGIENSMIWWFLALIFFWSLCRSSSKENLNFRDLMTMRFCTGSKQVQVTSSPFRKSGSHARLFVFNQEDQTEPRNGFGNVRKKGS
jgi:hypothetical protein